MGLIVNYKPKDDLRTCTYVNIRESNYNKGGLKVYIIADFFGSKAERDEGIREEYFKGIYVDLQNKDTLTSAQEYATLKAALLEDGIESEDD